jgi:hypothetical protein
METKRWESKVVIQDLPVPSSKFLDFRVVSPTSQHVETPQSLGSVFSAFRADETFFPRKSATTPNPYSTNFFDIKMTKRKRDSEAAPSTVKVSFLPKEKNEIGPIIGMPEHIRYLCLPFFRPLFSDTRYFNGLRYFLS